MIERFHRSLKSALRARLAGSNWIHHLPLVMLGLRNDPRMTQISLQQKLSTVLISHFQMSSSYTQSSLRRFFSRKCRLLSPGSLVLHVITWSLPLSFRLLRDDASKPPLAPLYRVPRQSDKFFVLQISDKSDSVSVDRLKPVNSTVLMDSAVQG